jgi:flavin reductase (DIM6/NTAB) family NADH-FMN oxidoreductase RutF
MISPSTSLDEFLDLMACWPTGVAVVTSTLRGEPMGCTVTAVASVSARPPLLLVSLAANSRTLLAIRRNRGRFGVCVLSAGQRDMAQRFAHGDPVDRFSGIGFTWQMDVPILDDAVTSAVCTVRTELAVADHVLVVGGPQRILESPDPTPVIWFQRRYWDLCPTGT